MCERGIQWDPLIGEGNLSCVLQREAGRGRGRRESCGYALPLHTCNLIKTSSLS